MRFDQTTKIAEIGGHTFKLKGYTRPNEKALIDADTVAQARAQKGEIDRFEYTVELLKAILDGPVEKIVVDDDFELRTAEEIIDFFIPESMRLAAKLIGL